MQPAHLLARSQGCDRLQRIVEGRPAGQPLVTVSNHASTLDDPTLFCAMLPLRHFATESSHGRVRWTLCANDICHSSRLVSQFFLAGKTLPIVRGGGPSQPILSLVAEQLRSRGDWLHVFPEGRVRQDGQLNPLKLGLASVLCDLADSSPVVLPFHHRGMEQVMVVKAAVPRINNRVRILVGEPIPMADLLARCRQKGVDQKRLAAEMMERVRMSLEELAERNRAEHS